MLISSWGPNTSSDGRNAEAIQEFEKAIALDPNFGPALNMLGYTHAETGDYEKAEAAFKRYIAANPGDANPIDSLAELIYLWDIWIRPSRGTGRPWTPGRILPGSCADWPILCAEGKLRENHPAFWSEFLARAHPRRKWKLYGSSNFIDYFLGRLEKSLAGFLALRKICRVVWLAYYRGQR